MSTHRRVWAEIDLDALRHNLARARRRLPSRGRILGVVKADAYGHGAIPVSRVLAAEGIDMLGVGDSEEAIALRSAGIAIPILVLGASLEAEISAIIAHGITPTIHSPERIGVFAREARRAGVRLPVHLLVDTGMGRLGVTPERAVEHLRAIAEEPSLELAGIGTHLAHSQNAAFTREQVAIFDAVLFAANASGLRPPRIHVASSIPFERYPETSRDMVRLGGALYGLSLDPAGASRDLPRPVLSVRTQVVYLRDLPAGTPISYGGTHVTSRPTRIATLPIGYHDGFVHALSNRAEVLIRGQRCPVVGRVTMDYAVIDITENPGVQTGDTVTILGDDGGDRIHAAELAAWAGTNCYEIPTRLGPRVVREYRGTIPDPHPRPADRRSLGDPTRRGESIRDVSPEETMG